MLLASHGDEHQLRVWLGWMAACWTQSCLAGDAIDLPPRPTGAAPSGAREERTATPLTEPLPGSPVQSLALGMAFTCSLLTGGGVKCWGSNADGVLGPGVAPAGASDPSTLSLLDFGTDRQVVQLSAGWYHVCVLFDDEHARCWGRNDSGQLGRGNTETYGDDAGESLHQLQDVPLDHILAISAGVSNTCALVRADSAGDGRAGTVHCWGRDVDGGLGDAASGSFGDDEPIHALRPVALPALATLIAAGDSLGCARLLDGQVNCWGSNAFGALGIGDIRCNIGDERLCEGLQDRVANLPVRGLSGLFVSDLKLNQAHACAVDNAGQLFCWGRNDQSRAGYPEVQLGSVLWQPPRPVQLGAQVAEVSLGTRHGCARDGLGQLRCWGEAGPQLGYGQDVTAPTGEVESCGSRSGLVPTGQDGRQPPLRGAQGTSATPSLRFWWRAITNNRSLKRLR